MYILYRDCKVFYKYKKTDKVPTLYLHGWGGSTKSFITFEEGDIALDFPPFGKSEKPKYVYTLDDYTNIVIEILKKHNLETVNVVAHSFGARVALSLASKYNIINKLIITGGAGLKPRFSFKKYIRQQKYKRAKRLVKRCKKPKEYLDSFGSSDYKSLDEKMKKTFVNIVNFYQNDILKDIKCATLLVWGKNDSETPLYMAKTMKKKIKDCELVVYAGGHFAYLENSYAFSQIINSFFKE